MKMFSMENTEDRTEEYVPTCKIRIFVHISKRKLKCSFLQKSNDQINVGK